MHFFHYNIYMYSHFKSISIMPLSGNYMCKTSNVLCFLSTVGWFLSQYGWYLVVVTALVYLLIQYLNKRMSSQSYRSSPPQTPQGQHIVSE